jgi:hypothetical protein
MMMRSSSEAALDLVSAVQWCVVLASSDFETLGERQRTPPGAMSGERNCELAPSRVGPAPASYALTSLSQARSSVVGAVCSVCSISGNRGVLGWSHRGRCTSTSGGCTSAAGAAGADMKRDTSGGERVTAADEAHLAFTA